MRTIKFKSSEVGPIPEEWEVVCLGQMIYDRRAQLQTGPFGTVLSASEFVDAGHPVISVREIRTGYIKLFDETPCVDDKTYNELKKYALSANDLVFARKGSVDRSALVPNDGIGYFLGSDGICVRFDGKTIVPKYVLGYFQSETTRKYLVSQSYGTTMAGLNEGIMRNLRIVLPPLPEQERIAEALSDVDALLLAMTTLIEKKRAIKQGAMQQLLTGKKRLVGFTGPWVKKRLGDVCEVLDNRRVPLNDSQRKSGPYPYCGANGVVDYIDRYAFNVPVILIAEDGGNFSDFATRPIAYQMSGKFWVNNHAHVLVAKEGYFQDYIFCQLEHKDITDVISGGTRAKLTRGQLDGLLIILPPTLAEQKAIAAVLSDMDAEITALEAKRAKYESVKQGMMQELLTGKTRLGAGSTERA